MAVPTTYSALRRARYPHGALLALLVAMQVGGCSGLTLPFGDDSVAVTGATERTPQFAVASGLTDEDLIAIGSALRRADERRSVDDVTWANPVSGSEGRIIRFARVVGPGGSECRSFSTVVNQVDGVRAVTGIACRGAGGPWTVEGLAPMDAATS